MVFVVLKFHALHYLQIFLISSVNAMYGTLPHHHHFLSSLRGHRASTKHRLLVLFPAILLTSFWLFPFSNALLWTVLRHVCLGLSLLLFPCGFQSKASLLRASFPFLCVSYPFPLPSLDLHWHLNFFCSSPKFLIWNYFQPMDVQDSS